MITIFIKKICLHDRSEFPNTVAPSCPEWVRPAHHAHDIAINQKNATSNPDFCSEDQPENSLKIDTYINILK